MNFNTMNRFAKYTLNVSFLSGIFYTYNKCNKYYSPEEIKKHKEEEDVWVSYKGNVYDITKFINIHPGGKEKIMQAAGKPIEPYWEKYQQHYSENVLKILEEYKIGTTDEFKNIDDPYKDEPSRSEFLKELKNKPYNAEPDLISLRKNYITPNEFIFVRNHHPVPKIDISNYKLNLNDNNKEICLSIKELKKKFKSHNVTTTIQCAGNRRIEFEKIDKVLGLPWVGGAIFNAKWTGIYLKDLIKELNLDSSKKFVHLIGVDEPFDCSISIEKVMDENSEVLIAFEMNGKEIPPDHGYPLRAIVPGYFGGKNIKWLKEIKLSDEESFSTWQRGIAYKGLSPNIKDVSQIENKIIKNTPTIEELPVQSIICEVIEDYSENSVLVKGIAYSGGGKNIIRVDVSNNNGETWNTADLKEGSEQVKNKAWAWTFWQIELPKNNTKFLSKAIDISYNTQPDNIKNIWNLRGILNNSIFRYFL